MFEKLTLVRESNSTIPQNVYTANHTYLLCIIYLPFIIISAETALLSKRINKLDCVTVVGMQFVAYQLHFAFYIWFGDWLYLLTVFVV